MFERFTERSRQVVSFASEEARTLKHDYIGTEHLLLGLLREQHGLAARVLTSLDVTVDRVRAQVQPPVRSDEVTGQIPFTPRAKKVLELALREALSLGHNYIGTEHILLGVIRENDGVAVGILLGLNAFPGKIRHEIGRVLNRRDLLDTVSATLTDGGRTNESPWAFRLAQDLQSTLRKIEADRTLLALVDEICGKWVTAERKARS